MLSKDAIFDIRIDCVRQYYIAVAKGIPCTGIGFICGTLYRVGPNGNIIKVK